MASSSFPHRFERGARFLEPAAAGPRPRRAGKHLVWCADPALVEPVQALVAAHHQALANRDHRVVQVRPWRVITRLPLGGGMVAVKQFAGRPRPLAWGRPPRARAALFAASRLAATGFPAARALAAVEEVRWLAIPCSYLVTTWEEGARLRRGLDGDPVRRADLLVRAARYLAALHARGFSIDDFRPANIIVRGGRGSEPELLLIDFDSLRPGPVAWNRRLLNLYQLRRALGAHAPDAERDLLLHTYLASSSRLQLDPRLFDLLHDFLTPFRPTTPLPHACRCFARQYRL